MYSYSYDLGKIQIILNMKAVLTWFCFLQYAGGEQMLAGEGNSLIFSKSKMRTKAPLEII